MSSILRTWGTSTCLLCGHRLAWNEQRYCGACHVQRGSMISRLENDEDLLRVLYVCSRHGASIPHALFGVGQAANAATNARLAPLKDWLLAQVLSGKLSAPTMGVIWVEMSEEVKSLYQQRPKLTDARKAERYNESMRVKIEHAIHDSLLLMSVSEFRRQRDLGFDFLFPKGQDTPG